MGHSVVKEQYGRYFEIPKFVAKIGHQVNAICVDYRGSRQCTEIYEGGVRWECYGGLARYPLQAIEWWRAIKRRVGGGNADIVVVGSDPLQVVVGYRAAKRFEIPILADLSDNYLGFGMINLPGLRREFMRAIGSVDAVTCVSAPLAETVSVARNSPRSVSVIENGCPESFFHLPSKTECRERFKLPDQGILIGTTGHLHPSRGIDDLISAYVKLSANHKNCYLVLAGRLDAKTSIPRRPDIIYLGRLNYDDARVLIGALDIGVVCNLDTDFGRYCYPQKACEYMAARLPIVAAGVGVMKELMQNVPQYLYAPGNVGTLVDALEKQIRDRHQITGNAETWQDKAVKFERILVQTAGERRVKR